MPAALDHLNVSDGDPVQAPDLQVALTAGEFLYSDGATQIFMADGSTTYVEHGRETFGTWSIPENADGQFGSFWPPSYNAVYTVHWIVEAGKVSGLRFADSRGTRFDGRFR